MSSYLGEERNTRIRYNTIMRMLEGINAILVLIMLTLLVIMAAVIGLVITL